MSRLTSSRVSPFNASMSARTRSRWFTLVCAKLWNPVLPALHLPLIADPRMERMERFKKAENGSLELSWQAECISLPSIS